MELPDALDRSVEDLIKPLASADTAGTGRIRRSAVAGAARLGLLLHGLRAAARTQQRIRYGIRSRLDHRQDKGDPLRANRFIIGLANLVIRPRWDARRGGPLAEYSVFALTL
jgi:hypothetical protein